MTKDLVVAPKTGLRKSRKKVEITPIDTAAVQSLKLSPSEVLALVQSALLKEGQNLSASESEALAMQDDFVLDYIREARVVSADLNDRHDNAMQEIQDSMHDAVAWLDGFVTDANAKHGKFCEAASTMSTVAAQELLSAFGSNDPND